MSNTDLVSEEMAGSTADQYCSISEAMKLINQTFEGDKRKLKEFIENVSTAFELVRPKQHGLLKFVKTKITGEARSKLIVRDLTSTWREVRQILEENYGVKRTLDLLRLPHV
jgi:N-glycosylase/DNA lyase